MKGPTVRPALPALVLAFFLTVFLACASAADAQRFQLAPADIADSGAVRTSVRRLALEILELDRDSSAAGVLDDIARLQLILGRDREAADAFRRARAARAADPSIAVHERARNRQLEIYAVAREDAARTGTPFADAFARAFRDAFAELDDRLAARVARAILVPASTVAGDLRWATPDLSGRTDVSLGEALTFLRVHAAAEAYRAFVGLPAPLIAEDNARRYTVETNVQVRTVGSATVCAIVVRPRSAERRLPSLLQFTIYADSVVGLRDAMLAAAHGYVGVTGFTRGKACSLDTPVPYLHDGSDAAALIDWIAVQPWSDGRVGMYGGSYSGFTAWAAARHAPPALRAIMVGAPAGPGIDIPMEGNVVWNFMYQWPFYTTNNRWLDNATYFDAERWTRMSREWYRSGRAYRDLERIDGTPNPLFAEWLQHPAYDAYWRAMMPQAQEYAALTIPVLQTAGYFFGGPGAALHYFRQHHRHSANAEHYLVIGPWEHLQAQRGVVTALGDTATYLAGWLMDPVGALDLVTDLRFPWFDHVLKGAPRPPLLRDRLNFQVVGTNAWRHASSVSAASNGSVRLYLNAARSGGRYSLSRQRPRSGTAIPHVVNLADRSDIETARGNGLLGTTIDTANAIVLVGEPLPNAMELSGLLSGRLEVITNKRDFDFSVTVYELMADGQYFQLPPYTGRASHVESLETRRLLTPGRPERLDFTNHIRFMSRRVAAGSRIVAVVAVLKSPAQQINYGSGKPVNEETIADAGAPLRIRWLAGSYLELPVWTDAAANGRAGARDREK